METVFVVSENERAKCEEIGAPKHISDPVVYKLIRVEGDGRLVPETDDEVMEVEDLLVDEQIKLPVIVNAGTAECISNDSASGNPPEESTEDSSASEGTVADIKSSAHPKDITASLSFSFDSSHINESGTKGECSKHLEGPIGSISGSKIDLYASNSVMCLDSLSTRELHELFRATFGRETAAKDKLWLKRRITMGLTNSCDVSTTTFTIINNKLVNTGKENRFHSVHDMLIEGSDGGVKNLEYENPPASYSNQLEELVSVKRPGSFGEENYASDDHIMDQRAAKRVRKPTKRYIEELSEVEPGRDQNSKENSSAKTAGHEETSPTYYARPRTKVCSNERSIVTRVYSLGGSRVQVPYVSRVRRSRPRKNILALMNFNQSGMCVTAKLVNETLSVPTPLPDSESEDKVREARHASEQIKPLNFNQSGMCVTAKLVNETLSVPTPLPDSESEDKVREARHASEQIKPLFTAEPEEDKERSEMGTFEQGKNLGLKETDSSEDYLDDSIAAVHTVKGGMRRKHHRAWTLVEVMKLVEGVSKCGTGRWSEIKKLSFATFSYRTSVDLKDKWRNLLKASYAQTTSDDGSRKHAAAPIPASVLFKVRELAEMHAQAPPTLGMSKLAANITQTVHQTRPGYL